MTTPKHAYYAAHGEAMELAVSKAIHGVLTEKPTDPIARLSELIAARGDSQPSAAPGGPARLVLPPRPNSAASSPALASTHHTNHDWALSAWLVGQHDVGAAVAASLLNGQSVADELAFARELPCIEEAVEELLRQGGVLKKLAQCVAAGVAQLQEADAVTAAELHDKFAVKAFTLQLGDLDVFYRGLEGLVGSPSPKVYQGMEREHFGVDCDMFDMPNRKAKTNSAIEWRFVACPEQGADGEGAEFLPYPKPDNSRQPLPFSHFEAALAQLNKELANAGFQQSVSKEEFIAARLYTGPMYLKYNAVLRGLQFEFAKQSFDQLCKGNKYTTTLHAINSAIIKMSKLTKAAKVYRGVSGGKLPEACCTSAQPMTLASRVESKAASCRRQLTRAQRAFMPRVELTSPSMGVQPSSLRLRWGWSIEVLTCRGSLSSRTRPRFSSRH